MSEPKLTHSEKCRITRLLGCYFDKGFKLQSEGRYYLAYIYSPHYLSNIIIGVDRIARIEVGVLGNPSFKEQTVTSEKAGQIIGELQIMKDVCDSVNRILSDGDNK